MSSAEFIYQLGFDAGVESRDEEVIKAHFEGEVEMAKRLVKVWQLDTVSAISEINQIEGLIKAILATAGLADEAKNFTKEK